MASTGTEKLKALITAIEKIMQCPVCYDPIRSSLKMCLRGHIACMECAIKLLKCPICRGKLTLENPIFLKNMLEVLPRVCPYDANGCDEVLGQEEYQGHVKYCSFRLIACRRPDCKAKMPLNLIIEHYKAQHPKAYMFTEETKLVQTKIEKNCKFIKYTPVQLFSNVFWLVEVNDVEKNQFKIYFEATPLEPLKHDHYVRVTFEKENFNFTSTLKANILHDCEAKLTWDDVNNHEENLHPTEENCMKISHSKLALFMKDTELVFQCFFFREQNCLESSV